MARFLDIALSCIARGWYVHPLTPRDKGPVTLHGKDDATRDEVQIRTWWADKTDRNVGISCGPSGLCVVDVDHGFACMSDFTAWRDRNGLPVTYAVRSGRRPEFGVQSYYSGHLKDGKFALDGASGDIKSTGGYVLAAGSIHPSGEEYRVIVDAPIAPLPSVVDKSRVKPVNIAVGDEPITENRNTTLTSIAGRLRTAGLSTDALRAALLQVNADRCAPPLEDEEVEQIAGSVARYALPEPDPEVVIGKPEKTVLTDWRQRYHSFAEIHDTKPPSFVIKDFLQEQSITGLAAPVGQRKSLIALNVAHACLTGEPLFGYFAVEKRPARVLYLCPEMGIISFANRLKLIGLESYVGETLFCRTMGSEPMDLSELTEDELRGAVVIIDTAVRFLKGDENSPKDMSVFAQSIFRLSNAGAIAIILLHHSTKATKDSPELTLENTMRGSGELGAFLTTCWATKMRDPNDEYKSASYLKNVKPRDFECKPFDTVCDRATCRMSIVGTPGDAGIPVKIQKDKDGKEDAALAVIRANVSLSNEKLSELLAEHGIKRSPEWVRKHKRKSTGGATHTSE